jgi:PAS domain S-box-containing protein
MSQASKSAGVPRTTLKEQLEEVRAKLLEATETLDAIRNGEVDALVVAGPNGSQVFSLAGAEQPYRIYVEQMDEGAVTLSADGTILYANRRFAEMIGHPLERVIGSPFADCVDGGEGMLAIIFAATPDAPAKTEVTLGCANEKKLPVLLSASHLPNGEEAVYCLVVTDLTVQHEQTRLRVAKEAAEAASAAKDNFMAALSHELRTPLTPALMTAAQIEHDPELPPRLREDVAIVRGHIELEARLIDDLLDLTRIAHGKIDMQLHVIDLKDAIHLAISICRPAAQDKGVVLESHLADESLHVNADTVRLQQALWNLVRNSVKFTPPGGRVDVRARRVGDKLRVDVVDTGIGIPAESVGRIFNAFEQGDRSITREFGGLGLGLAITRAIVNLHGGQVSAASGGTGLGAIFTIVLPAAQSDLAAQNRPQESAGAGESLRILLVEDHAETRRSMTLLLKRIFHHEVTAAGTAAEALTHAAEAQFDLVISDLGLPDISGLELMRQLKRLYQMRGICLSGFGMEEDLKSSHAAGFEQHLTKPVSIEQLGAAIRRVSAKHA